jgi:hypothetical protein
MARIRTIKPEFPQSESMGKLTRDARLCFIMLWTLADDSGRLRGNSRMLASLLFPYDKDAPDKIDKWLIELEDVRSIQRYKDDLGDSYLQILNWTSHQKIDKPSVSKLPAPPSVAIREHSRGLDDDSGGFVDGSRTITPGSEEGIRGSRSKDHSLCTEPQGDSMLAMRLSPFKFKTCGEGYWHLHQSKLDEWKSTFTGIDVESQLRMAAQWLKDNPAKRKTDKGMVKFLGAWLTRVQDSYRGPVAQMQPTAKKSTLPVIDENWEPA